jgi:hypothetical protein
LFFVILKLNIKCIERKQETRNGERRKITARKSFIKSFLHEEDDEDVGKD